MTGRLYLAGLSCGTGHRRCTIRPVDRTLLSMRTGVAVIMLGFLLVHIAGCTASRAIDDDPLGGAPEDFSLELTILHGRGVPAQSDVTRRSGQFVLHADGSLHHEEDIRRRAVEAPGLVRRLDRPQQGEVWLLLRQINFADPERGEPSINLQLLTPGGGEIMHQLAITADERRWVFVTLSRTDQPVDPALGELIERLASLAWLPKQAPPARVVVPQRYDFGPDPYARYR